MKLRKTAALLAGMVCAAVLSGCTLNINIYGSQEPTRPETEVVETRETTLETEAAMTPEALGREEDTFLEFYLEGEPVQEAVTLFLGEGYSLYVPREGWTRQSLEENAAPVDKWHSDRNQDVFYAVAKLDGMDLTQAQNWVRTFWPAHSLIEDKQGGLMGEGKGLVFCSAFFPGPEGQYAVLWQYPDEAAEGFGVTLSVLTDTFAAFPQ